MNTKLVESLADAVTSLSADGYALFQETLTDRMIRKTPGIALRAIHIETPPLRFPEGTKSQCIQSFNANLPFWEGWPERSGGRGGLCNLRRSEKFLTSFKTIR